MLENIGNTDPKKDEEPKAPSIQRDFSNIYWEIKNKKNFSDPDDEDINRQEEKEKRPDDDFDC